MCELLHIIKHKGLHIASTALAVWLVGAKAQNGDVISSHINHPDCAAGIGVMEGILRPKAEGLNFVKLDEGL